MKTDTIPVILGQSDGRQCVLAPYHYVDAAAPPVCWPVIARISVRTVRLYIHTHMHVYLLSVYLASLVPMQPPSRPDYCLIVLVVLRVYGALGSSSK